MYSAKANNFFRVIRTTLHAMVQYPPLAVLFVIGTVLQGVFQGALVWALREVLFTFSSLGNVSFAASLSAALLILVISLLQSATAFMGEMATVRLAYRIQTDAMANLLAKVLSLPIRYFDKHSQGDLVMSAYQDLQGIRSATEEVGRTVLYITRLLGLGVVALLISPKLALIGVVSIPLVCWPAYILGQRITRAAERERGAVAIWHDTFVQVSSGIRSIKVNRSEPHVLATTRHIGEQIYQQVVQKAQHKGFARFLLEAVSGVSLILVLVIGGRDVAAGQLDWQSLLGLLVAVLALYSPIVSLLHTYSTIQGIIPNLDRVDRILHAPVTTQDRPGALPLHTAPATIELRDLSFAYDNQIVLDGVSATFYGGETVGIVGPSGAGKSTLLALLLRFYEPTGGTILFDGVDLRDIRYADVLDQCAIVLQEPFLFVDTIANNIRAARPSISLADVIEAAKAANLHDEIMRMEQGYDTLLGRNEEGRSLSVGQKQRLCIAAALLKNAPILFLDEATSNLDSVSERHVQQAIDQLMTGRTTFIIAHRLSTLRDADRILVLDQGKLAGLAPHEELLQTCPVYQRLWRYQSAEELPTDRASVNGWNGFQPTPTDTL